MNWDRINPNACPVSQTITTSVFWCGLMDKHHRRVNAQSYSLCFQHPTSVCLMWRINKSSSVRGREHRPWWRPFTPLTNGCLSRWVLFWPREQRRSKNSLNASNWTREAWIDLKLKKGRLIWITWSQESRGPPGRYFRPNYSGLEQRFSTFSGWTPQKDQDRV